MSKEASQYPRPRYLSDGERGSSIVKENLLKALLQLLGKMTAQKANPEKFLNQIACPLKTTKPWRRFICAESRVSIKVTPHLDTVCRAE